MMHPSPFFDPKDRFLIVTPHPADAALALGGLLQRIAWAGSAARLLVMTGEPAATDAATDEAATETPVEPLAAPAATRLSGLRRWLGRRWRRGAAEGARQEAQRRRETRQALSLLHFLDGPTGPARHTARQPDIPVRCEHAFFELPAAGPASTPRDAASSHGDLGAGLMRGEQAVARRLCAELERWRPTRLVFPSAWDSRPEHHALWVFLQIALHRAGMAGLPRWEYLAHCRQPDRVPGCWELALTDEERWLKRRAVLCHPAPNAAERQRLLELAYRGEFYSEPAHEPLREPLAMGAWGGEAAGERETAGEREAAGEPLRSPNGGQLSPNGGLLETATARPKARKKTPAKRAVAARPSPYPHYSHTSQHPQYSQHPQAASPYPNAPQPLYALPSAPPEELWRPVRRATLVDGAALPLRGVAAQRAALARVGDRLMESPLVEPGPWQGRQLDLELARPPHWNPSRWNPMLFELWLAGETATGCWRRKLPLRKSVGLDEAPLVDSAGEGVAGGILQETADGMAATPSPSSQPSAEWAWVEALDGRIHIRLPLPEESPEAGGPTERLFVKLQPKGRPGEFALDGAGWREIPVPPPVPRVRLPMRPPVEHTPEEEPARDFQLTMA